jgi:hypothetical protein
MSSRQSTKQRTKTPASLPMNPSPDDQAVYHTISPALLLDVFDEPVVFNRAFIGITGSATAALFLSYAVYTTERLPVANEGWFEKTHNEWGEDTGLTRFEQKAARHILTELGILIERRVGMPARLLYKLRADRLMELLTLRANERWAGIQ